MNLHFSRKRRHSVLEAPGLSTTTNGKETKSNSNIKVVVRIRPENEQEQNGNSCVKPMNDHVLVFDPNEQSSPGYGGPCKKSRDILKRPNKDLKFAFDAVFGPCSNNIEVYERTTKQILDGLLNGYNCSVFAYGATGAGKTHTMLGNPSEPGVMYLTMLELYARIDAMDTEKKCEIAVSYLEVYNEQIHDLLIPRKGLPVREDPQSGVVIQGLSLHKPRSAEELLEMLQFGNRNRSQHPTDANAESSRSHAVFQVFVRQRDRTANISAEIRVAKMCLVDLAGSERATVTKNRGARMREGANINRSLLALGNVINALADHKFKGHIPYRDSKLTRLLKDSLGGNCQTVMIAAVSPSHFSYEDSYNTLRYADRAKYIRTALKKNILNVDFHVARYGQIVEELRTEIAELKTRLQVYEENKLKSSVSVPNVLNEKILSLQTQLQADYKTRMSIQQSHLKIHSNCHNLKWKIFRKERFLPRFDFLSDIQKDEKIAKLMRGLQQTKEKCRGLQLQEQNSIDEMAENSQQIQQLESQVLNQLNHEKSTPQSQLLETNLQLYQCQMELKHSQRHIQCLKRAVHIQYRDSQTSERLLLKLLKLVKDQHFILKGHDLATSDIESEFETVQTIVKQQEVSWADESSHSPTPHTSYTLNELLSFPAVPSLHSDTNNIKPALTCDRVNQREPELVSREGDITRNVTLSSSNAEHINNCSVEKSSNMNSFDENIKESTKLFAGYTPALKKLNSFAHSPKHKIQFVNKHFDTGAENKDKDNLQCTNFDFPIPSTNCFSVTKKCLPNKKVTNVQKEEKIGSDNCCQHTTDETFIISSGLESSELSSTISHVNSPKTVIPGAKSDDVQSDLSNEMQQLNLHSHLQRNCDKTVLPSSAVTNSMLVPPSNTEMLTVVKSNPPQSNNVTSGGLNRNINSLTVTKSQPSMEKDNLEGKKAVIRSINFNTNSTPVTPTRSYADAVKSPTPVRIPLKQMNGNNTPLAMPLDTPDKKTESPCSTIPRNGRVRQNVLLPTCLKKSIDENAKESVKALQNLGLPSLVEQSYKRRNGNIIIGRSATPGYLQPTKAAVYRNHWNRDTPKSNDPVTLKGNERWRLKVKRDATNNHKSRIGIRSQSASSLLRPGWQI